jgi:hypothetical protein
MALPQNNLIILQAKSTPLFMKQFFNFLIKPYKWTRKIHQYCYENNKWVFF